MLLYKYRGLSNLHFISDILVHQRLYCAKWNSLNDPLEGAFLEEGFGLAGNPVVIRGDLETLYDVEEEASPRVCSLSAAPTSMRLWSLYADGHRGVAIEIDTDRVSSRPPLQVRYTRNLPKFSRTCVGQALSHKTRHWAYEREFRYITQEEYIGAKGGIRRVLLGVRLSRCERLVIRRLIPEDVSVVEMRLDRDHGEVYLA